MGRKPNGRPLTGEERDATLQLSKQADNEIRDYLFRSVNIFVKYRGDNVVA